MIKICKLPWKPLCVLNPRIISRFPAPQPTITAKTLDIIIASFKKNKAKYLADTHTIYFEVNADIAL